MCQQQLHTEIYCFLLGEEMGSSVASETSSSREFYDPFLRGDRKMTLCRWQGDPASIFQ